MTEEVPNKTHLPRVSRRVLFALVGFAVSVAVNLFLWQGDQLISNRAEGPFSAVGIFTLAIPTEIIGHILGYSMMTDYAPMKVIFAAVFILWGLVGAMLGLFIARLFPGKKGVSKEVDSWCEVNA